MRLVLLSVLLLSVVFAHGSPQEKTSKVIEPALVDVLVEKEYEVYSNVELINGYPELSGRKYHIKDTRSAKGFFVSSDGKVLVDSSLFDRESNIDQMLDALLDLMLNDAARIAHVKIFGIEAIPDEVEKFKSYTINSEGGRQALLNRLKEFYLQGKIVFSEKSSSTSIKTSSGSLINASVESSTSAASLIQSSINNTPTLDLHSSENTSNGDTAYVISYANNLSVPVVTTVFINNTEGSPGFTVPPSSGSNNDLKSYFNVVVDKDGKPVAVDFENDKKPVTFEEVKKIEKESESNFTGSDLNALFSEGIEFYEEGEPDKAKDAFSKIIEVYPEHAQAKKYLGEIKDGKPGAFKLPEFGPLPVNFILIVVLIIGISYVLNAINKRS